MDKDSINEARDYIAYELEGMVDDLVYGMLDRVINKLDALKLKVDGRLPADDDRLILLNDLITKMNQKTTPSGQYWCDFDRHRYFLYEVIGMLLTNDK